MSSWSGIRAKLEKDYLAPSLRGRIQYFVTSYSKCPDHEGRASVRLDGREILKSSYYEYDMAYSKAFHEAQALFPEAAMREHCSMAVQAAMEGGDFDQHVFYNAFQEFDNQSIEKSLASPNPIVRMFAYLDRRVGKRRLALLKTTVDHEIAWLRFFIYLRLTAEGME